MTTPRVVVIVQARTGSTRLPQKILLPLSGKPMLLQQLNRLKEAKRADAFLLATTDTLTDDSVVELAHRSNMEFFRGDEGDVLDRYYKAAKAAKADIVVRVTGDCPLHDPEVIDLVIDRFFQQKVDYTITPTNFPEGLDTEVFSFWALERAWKEATLPSESEHVTPFIRNHPDYFKIDVPWTSGAGDHSPYHWSVDTREDFEFVQKVYGYLYIEEQIFHMNDILKLLEEKPELMEINKGGTGYEGLQKSLREDEEFKKQNG